jgi:ABC-2 type transport system ATP-binding protein
MNEQPVIRTRGLTRYFGFKPAVYELDLEVPRGGIFAFLGRNGSGKTTTIRMLLGLLSPTRGEGSVLGCDIRALTPATRARIGYLAEDHPLYGWMTVRESGEFQASFFPQWNEKIFRGVIGHFGLSDRARVKDLSRGERAGLSLALTLAPDPELLILDDPGMGLDPVARRSLVESMIYLTRCPDRTIFFSTHQLTDVERVAERVAVLDRSVLRTCCLLETFRNRVRQVRLFFSAAAPPLPEIAGLLQVVRMDRELRIIYVQPDSGAEPSFQSLNPLRVESAPLTLEDAFISYLGERGERSFILSEMEAQP